MSPEAILRGHRICSFVWVKKKKALLWGNGALQGQQRRTRLWSWWLFSRCIYLLNTIIRLYSLCYSGGNGSVIPHLGVSWTIHFFIVQIFLQYAVSGILVKMGSTKWKPNCRYFIKFPSKPYVQLDSDLEFTIIQYILYNTIHLYNTVHFTLKRSVKLWFTNMIGSGSCYRRQVACAYNWGSGLNIRIVQSRHQWWDARGQACVYLCAGREECVARRQNREAPVLSAAKTTRCSNLASNIYLLNPHSACAGHCAWCGTVSKWTPGTLLTQNLQSYLW